MDLMFKTYALKNTTNPEAKKNIFESAKRFITRQNFETDETDFQTLN